MAVVVTGATGHVGANLVRALIASQRPVRALIHRKQDPDPLAGINVEKIEGDVCDIVSLYRALRGADVVYHLAARISLHSDEWPLLESVNVMGTRNVVEACLSCGVRRLVHFSAIQALVQEPLNEPVSELRPLAESIDYPPFDRSKALGEREVRNGIEMGLDAVIINPSGIIGPHDYHLSNLGRLLVALANHKLPALVRGGLDCVDVRDIVDGAMRAEERAVTGAKYLLSGHEVTISELADTVEEITGIPAPRFVFPAWLAQAGVPALTTYNRLAGKGAINPGVTIKTLYCNRHINHDRATRELDYCPRPLKQTLLDTLRWYQKNGMLNSSVKLIS